ncbi:MAG TPA: energy transducer TonB [Pyrinomonadaceae bacterium]|nr:energy transducer TonB [Pyrinomonadaceae bacterium]
MSRILILSIAFLIWSTGSPAFAQDEKPKTEVDRLIAEAKERGEVVLGRCLEDCGDKVIDADVEAGRALELPKPRYPELARKAHVSGQVTVQLLIHEDGTVMSAVAVSGHPLLYGVSVEAARQSRFSPTKVDGQPVKVTGVITYNFSAR